MDNPNEYNQDWPPSAMLSFNRHVFGEKEVVCQWVDNGTPCNDLVKGRNFKDHLHDRHGVTSDLQSYVCQWHGCPSDQLEMRRSSLKRHTKEQHVPFRWPCPYCRQTFTREVTLITHIGRSPEHE